MDRGNQYLILQPKFSRIFIALFFLILAHFASEIKPLEHPFIEVTQPEAEAKHVRCLKREQQ